MMLAKKAAIDAINAYYKALNNQSEIDKKHANDQAIHDSNVTLAKSTEDYVQKLAAITDIRRSDGIPSVSALFWPYLLPEELPEAMRTWMLSMPTMPPSRTAHQKKL